MENDIKDLEKEIINKVRSVIYWPLMIFGLCRFDIQGNKIVKKEILSIIISIAVTITINFCAFFIGYKLWYERNFLLITELGAVMLFDIFHTLVLSNMNFVNKESAAKSIIGAIEIDAFLGVKHTNFLREISANTYITLVAIDGLLHCVVMFFLYITYLSAIEVGVVGAIYFIILFMIYYDLSIFVSLYIFLTLRVRYLNLTILQIANVEPETIPTQFPFYPLFWSHKFDKLVDFHKRATTENILSAFRMIFSMKECLENCYRFTIFLCLSYISIGTFFIVQNIIMYIKSTQNVELLRLVALTLWGILSWTFHIGMTQQVDMFARQCKQTSLMCTYIQLNPSYSEEVYKLTSQVLHTLETRDPRVSIYGLFYYDTGMMLNVAASLIVYVTMHLQLAFFNNSDTIISNNETELVNFMY